MFEIEVLLEDHCQAFGATTSNLNWLVTRYARPLVYNAPAPRFARGRTVEMKKPCHRLARAVSNGSRAHNIKLLRESTIPPLEAMGLMKHHDKFQC